MLNHVVKLLAKPTPAAPSSTKGKERENAIASSNTGLTPATIVRSFFSYFAAFDWSKDIVNDPTLPKEKGDNAVKRSLREPVVIQSIFRPTARPNVAASCNRLSAETFSLVFTTAAEKVAEGDWEWCLRPKEDSVTNFLTRFRAYILIKLSMWDMEDIGGDKVREVVGTIESRVPNFMVALGRIEGLYARVWPERFRTSPSGAESTSELEGYYLVGVGKPRGIDDPASSKSVGLKIVNASNDFERLMREHASFDKSHAWVDVNVVTGKKVRDMDLRIDKRFWDNVEQQPEVPVLSEVDELTISDTAQQDAAPAQVNAQSSAPRKGRTSTKLRPAQDVISRIKWDPSLNAEDFLIGYEDRFLGVKETELMKWKMEQTDMEFIPAHRIVWIRKNGEDGGIVWDRKAKLDILFHSGNSKT